MRKGALKWTAAALALVMSTTSLTEVASAQDWREQMRQAREEMRRAITQPAQQQPVQQQVQPTITWAPEQRANFESAQRSYAGAIQGLAIGAILGALVCRQLFEGNMERTACTVAMAAVGGGLGRSVDRRNQRLVQDRDQVVASLEEAERARQANTELLAATNVEIASLERRISDSEQQLRRNRINSAQHEANLAAARSDFAVIARGLETVEGAVQQQTRAYEDLNTRAGNAEDPAVRETQPGIQAELTRNSAFQTQSVAPARARLTQIRERIGTG